MFSFAICVRHTCANTPMIPFFIPQKATEIASGFSGDRLWVFAGFREFHGFVVSLSLVCCRIHRNGLLSAAHSNSVEHPKSSMLPQ